jgi:dipeptidyl aminopeptidase/acylaminoacyl peptidase
MKVARFGRFNRIPAVAFATMALCAIGSAREPTADSAPTIEQFIKIRWPVGADLSADGGLYFVHDPDGIRQLYKVPPGAKQEQAVKLTEFPDGISGYDLSEDGKWIAITAARGGSEQTALYLMDAATGKMETLFENPNVVFESTVWRRDSKAFAYRSNETSSSDFHVYVFDLAGRKGTKVYEQKGSNAPVDFNKDGSKLMVMKYTSASFSQLFEVDLTSGQSREITPPGEEWSFEPVGYDAEENGFLVNTNYKGDLMTLYAIHLKTGTLNKVPVGFEGKEIDFAGLSFDRSTMAVGVNEDGYRTLHLFRVRDMSRVPTPTIGKGIVGNIDITGNTLLYALDNANTPGIVFRYDLSKPDQPPVPVTQADTQGIDVSKFLLPELIEYPSFDGLKVPAFLYLPTTYKKGDKIPFLVQYHGGPEAQYRPNFNRPFQYFLSRGYGVLAPNVRGSSGYGKAYIEADDYKNREKSVKDGIWAVKWLIDQGYTDKKMVAAWGGSYGGFMVMATITEAPELFGAACNIVGIVNFETFLKQTKDYRRALREVEYGPLTDLEFLKSVSPIYKVDKIDTPLMIAHDLNDPRVPVGEAMQIAVALKKRGKTVEELYFPDEGHGFAKEDNRLLFYQQMARFIEKHLPVKGK